MNTILTMRQRVMERMTEIYHQRNCHKLGLILYDVTKRTCGVANQMKCTNYTSSQNLIQVIELQYIVYL